MTRIISARIGLAMAAVCTLAGVVTATAQSVQLYVSSASRGKVLRYDGVSGNFINGLDSTVVSGVAIPSGLVLSTDGNLCVGNSGLHSILRFDAETGLARPGPLGGVNTAEFILKGSGGLNTPVGMILRGGKLYVTSRGTNEVLRYNVVNGDFIDTFVEGALSRLDSPDDLTFGPDGNLYVTSLNTSSVLRYNHLTGLLMDTFVSAESGGLKLPRGLIFGPDGNLYVSSAFTNSILRYNGRSGEFMDVFVPFQSGGLNFPRDLLFGPDGNLYVCSQTTDSILRYDGQTGAFIGAFVPPSSGGLRAPAFMVFSNGSSTGSDPTPSNGDPASPGVGPMQPGDGPPPGSPPGPFPGPFPPGIFPGGTSGCGSGLCGIGTAMAMPMMLFGLGWMRRRRPHARR